MLTRSASDRPGKEAIVSRARRVTFLDLDEASTRIAHFLRSRGVENGMRVAIYSSKCAEEAALIFGIAKAGCVLVHVNPSFRDQQLQHVIQECEPAALFFHPSKGAMVERAARDGVLPRKRFNNS
jgi:acyl-CoA synthetase (AMP-forming)/AMP-acid ligase II